MTTASEIRRAFRSLVKTPRATLVAILTLALGIGASTAIFTVVHAVLLQPLPYPEPDRIVQVWQASERYRRNTLSLPNFQDLKEQNRSLQAFAVYAPITVSVAGGSEPVRLGSAPVSREFFDVLRVEPARGRRFSEEEMREGAAPVVIVSYAYWQRYLGADPDLGAHRLRFRNEVYSVIGVMGRGFSFPPGTDLWVSEERSPGALSRTAHNWRAVGRLADGIALEAARSDLSAVAKNVRATYGEDTWMLDANVVPLREEMVGAVAPALLVLMGAVGFLLLVAAANVVNLLLARAQSKKREVAVSAALGASRTQLMRPFLWEAAMLALGGGALGIVAAVWGVRALLAFEPGNLPRTDEIGTSFAMLSFALALSIGTALGLGLVASLRATRADVQKSIHTAERSQAGAGRRAGSNGLLVASQVALTLVLLVGAGLLGRSLFRLLEVDPGFRHERRLAMDLYAPYASDDDERRRLASTQETLLEELGAIPGVTRIGGIDLLPLATGSRNGLFIELRDPDEIQSFEDFGRLVEVKERTAFAEYRAATPGLFATLGIPLLRGRAFEASDSMDSLHVAVISQSLASSKWPGEDPLGKLIEFGNMDGQLEALHVVGVVGDVRHVGLDAEPKPTIYTNARQRPSGNFTVVLETAADPAAIVPAAQRIVRELVPDVPPRFRTLDDVLASSMAERRFNLLLLSVFGATALCLAVMGIYGVVSYIVGRRTGEIGIRIALGASSSSVLKLILGQGFRPVALGILVGLVASFGLSRFLSSLLFDVSTTDPLTYVLLPLLLTAAALVACYVPARYATRVDPMRSLRAD